MVSVYQLKYPAPGLISQMKGFLATNRYQYTTLYVDQASRLSYIYPQKNEFTEDTL